MENQTQPVQSVQPAQPVQPTPEQPSVAMQIQQLLTQQTQLQQQYNQIVAFLKANPTQTSEKIQEIKLQLDQLNALYLQNQQKLQSLGYNTVQVNKPVEVKQGAKNNFSFKKLAIGCGFLLLFVIVGFGATLYFLIQNPNALTTVGINAATAKMLLQLFAGLILGVMGLVGLGFLFTNIYRLITVKNQSKVRYVFSLFLAVIILGVAGGVAGVLFPLINKIVTTTVTNTQIVFPHLVDAKKNYPLYPDEIQKLIAPSEFTFELSLQALNAEMKKKYGQVKIGNIQLNCGNPQKQVIIYQTGDTTSADKCFYDKKGQYQITLDIAYENEVNHQRGMTNATVSTLDFQSEIQLFQTDSKTTRKPTQLSATQGAIILGKAPVKITVDATQIFRDFNLETYEVMWDMDNDSINDRENLATFDYIYKLPKVYYPAVKFPGISEDVIYTFPVRVEQSDVPVCEITFTPFEKTKYKIQTIFLDGIVSNISSYNYTILDASTKKVVDTIKRDTRDIDYLFPEKGNYLVVLDFITVDGKRGQCESDILQLDKETIDVTYTLKHKLPGDSQFTPIPTTDITRDAKGEETIQLLILPQTIQIDLTAVVPDTISTNKNIYVDGQVILNQGTLYQFDIYEEKTYEVLMVLEDADKDIKKEIRLHFLVKRPDIIGNLTLKPDTGYEPLNVILDASKTTLNIPDDEIIYFSRDFGDGESKKNLTNGVISHVYKYDYNKENGEYSPQVTVTTKKGLTTTFTAPAPQRVLVKKQLIQMVISSSSHPTQIARVGDLVQFLSEFNGLPDTMKWNFGDGSDPIQCKDRSCVEVSHMYALPGEYLVNVILEFKDMQTVETVLEMKIIN